MAKIKKRVIPAETPRPERPRVIQCHYTIYRHPVRDAGKGTFHNGPEAADLFAVHNGVVSMSVTTSAQGLYDQIVAEQVWYIANNPGRYSLVATVFGMSFTFIVMPDKSYHPGWLKWPELIRAMPR